MATKTATKTRTKIRPLHDKVIVRRDEAETMMGGIYLPESGKERPKSGVVEAVGDGALNHETGQRIPLSVKIGDRVVFTSYAGTEVKLEDNELLILTESEILAVID